MVCAHIRSELNLAFFKYSLSAAGKAQSHFKSIRDQINKKAGRGATDAIQIKGAVDLARYLATGEAL